MSKKILVVTPVVPFPEKGADQLDRASGIRQLVRLGYKVKVIAKRAMYQDEACIEDAAKSFGTEVITVPYKYTFNNLSLGQKLVVLFHKIVNPSLFDGAAYEYTDPEIQNVVKKNLVDWKPDLVWCDYTYLWPLYNIFIKYNIPIITRSANFEPKHFLDEDGLSLRNMFLFLPKLISEYKTLRYSNLVFAITPKEHNIYKKMSTSSRVVTLPLRSLPNYVNLPYFVKESNPLKVFFMGSTYNVVHNLKGLMFLINQVIPLANYKFPKKFEFHIFGAKMPEKINITHLPNVKYHGYVSDLQNSLSGMDVALIPSLCGAGMQQKIFEPLTIGIPSIVSSRGLAGYPFKDKDSVLLAESATDFVIALGKMLSVSFRKKISENAKKISKEIFNEHALDDIVKREIEVLIRGNTYN